MTGRPVLFYISANDAVLHDRFSDGVAGNLASSLAGMTRIVMTCYRAGQPVTELVIRRPGAAPFCLTIWQGPLSVTPVSEDDLRLGHKEIALPDTADTLNLVAALARSGGLSPVLTDSRHEAAVFEFRLKEVAL